MDIIEDKVDELEEVVSRVEARLFRLGLTGRGGERVGPGNGYVDWLAVSFFREWLAENTSPPPSADYTSSKHPPQIPERTRGGGGHGRSGGGSGSNGHGPGNRNRHNSSSSGSASGSATARNDPYAATPATPPHLSTTPLATLGRTFRLLGGSPKEYLTHDDCKRFLKLSPELYNRDNLRRFEKRIEELKAMAREVVRPLMGSGLELEISGCAPPTSKEGGGASAGAGGAGGVGGGGGAGGSSVLGYLTCTTVYDRDLPWMSYDGV